MYLKPYWAHYQTFLAVKHRNASDHWLIKLTGIFLPFDVWFKSHICSPDMTGIAFSDIPDTYHDPVLSSRLLVHEPFIVELTYVAWQQRNRSCVPLSYLKSAFYLKHVAMAYVWRLDICKFQFINTLLGSNV